MPGKAQGNGFLTWPWAKRSSLPQQGFEKPPSPDSSSLPYRNLREGTCPPAENHSEFEHRKEDRAGVKVVSPLPPSRLASSPIETQGDFVTMAVADEEWGQAPPAQDCLSAG